MYDLKPIRKKRLTAIAMTLFGLSCWGMLMLMIWVENDKTSFNFLFTCFFLFFSGILMSFVGSSIAIDAHKDLRHQAFFTFQTVLVKKSTTFQGRQGLQYLLELKILENQDAFEALESRKKARTNHILYRIKDPEKLAHFNQFYTANVKKNIYEHFVEQDQITITLSRYSEHVASIKKQSVEAVC